MEHILVSVENYVVSGSLSTSTFGVPAGGETMRDVIVLSGFPIPSFVPCVLTFRWAYLVSEILSTMSTVLIFLMPLTQQTCLAIRTVIVQEKRRTLCWRVQREWLQRMSWFMLFVTVCFNLPHLRQCLSPHSLPLSTMSTLTTPSTTSDKIPLPVLVCWRQIKVSLHWIECCCWLCCFDCWFQSNLDIGDTWSRVNRIIKIRLFFELLCSQSICIIAHWISWWLLDSFVDMAFTSKIPVKTQVGGKAISKIAKSRRGVTNWTYVSLQ